MKKKTVRGFVVMSCVSVAERVPEGESYLVMPILTQCLKDTEWCVRLKVAEQIIALQRVGGVEHLDLVNVIKMVLLDSNSKVRATALAQLHQFANNLDEDQRNTIMPAFSTYIRELYHDPSEDVQLGILAAVLGISPANYVQGLHEGNLARLSIGQRSRSNTFIHKFIIFLKKF